MAFVDVFVPAWLNLALFLTRPTLSHSAGSGSYFSFGIDENLTSRG